MDCRADARRGNRHRRCRQLDSNADFDSRPDVQLRAARNRDFRDFPFRFSLDFADFDDFYRLAFRRFHPVYKIIANFM